MNEALKIGLGITAGFVLLGFLIFLFVYLSSGQKQETLLKTDNVVLTRPVGGSVYTAQIKNNPGEAREEVYMWMRQELGLSEEEICNTSVIFRFSDDIGGGERNNFSPVFNACAP